MSRRGALAGGLCALAALAPLAAVAHTSLVRSLPAARSVVAETPPRLELWFSERLEPAYSWVSVWSAGGQRMDRQNVVVGPEDPKRLAVGLLTLRPGAYTVRYRVASIDGHILESSFTFTVGLTGSR